MKWGGKEILLLVGVLVLLSCGGGVEGSSILSSLFGKENQEGGAGVVGGKVEFEKYTSMFPFYWKEPNCTPRPPIDRYLLMSRRNGGWNNERLILENAIIFAWVTNRTLVLPARFRYDHMHGEENFENFVDLTYARCFVPIITSDKLPELSGGVINERFIGVDRHKDSMTVEIEFNNAAFPVPAVPTALSGASYDEFLEFEAFRSGRVTAWQLAPDDHAFGKHLADTGMEKMTVMQLDNSKKFLNSKNHFFCLFYAFFWFQDKHQHNQMIEIIKHGTHYREKFWDAASAIMADIGPPGSFSSIHIRARDFRSKSGYYHYFKQKKWIDNFRTHHKNTFNAGEHVYISTDEKNLEEIKEFQHQLDEEFSVKTFTIYDFFDRFNFDQGATNRRWEFWGESQIHSGDASQFNLNDLGLIEQIVCAHGRRFVGTYFSTFSAHIMVLRGYMTHPWLQKYEHLFWDRTLERVGKCTWGSVPEDCFPSWQGHFRGAMWASEFEEGWSTYEDYQERKKFFSQKELIPSLKHQKRFDPEQREKYEKMAKEEGGRGRTIGGGSERGFGERLGGGLGERLGGGVGVGRVEVKAVVGKEDRRMQFLQGLKNKINN